MKRTSKPKRGFLDGYKTFDPDTEGYGNAHEWKSAFNARMGFEEATHRMRDKDPHSVLGVSTTATWAEIKSAFRKLSMQYHPDRVATTGLDPKEAEEIFKQITAAYVVLERKYGKA